MRPPQQQVIQTIRVALALSGLEGKQEPAMCRVNLGTQHKSDWFQPAQV